jgi:hypothetical protein
VSTQRFPNPLTPQLLHALFRRLGARPDAWDSAAPLRASDYAPADPTRGCPPLANLRALLRLLELTAPTLAPDAGALALRTLLLLALDPRTPSTLPGPAAAALLASLPPPATARALRTLLTQTSGGASAHLRWRAVRAMPPAPPAAHAWRRRFAMACALDDGRWLDSSSSVGGDSAQSTPRGQPSGETEWRPRPITGAAAQARVCLLLGEPEAAPRPFDCGVPRRRKGKRKKSASSDSDDDGEDEEGGGGAAAGRPDHAALAAALRTLDVAVDAGFAPPPAAAGGCAAAHDAAADAVAAAVEALRARVLSGLAGAGGGAAGPAHLGRLAADAAAGRLANRLRMGVRLGRPAPRDWYGGGGPGGDAAALERWVGAAGGGRAGGAEGAVGGAGVAADDEDEDMGESGDEDDSA